MTIWNSISLQESASSQISHMVMFHDHLMLVLILIIRIILYIMIFIRGNKFVHLGLVEHQLVEVVWTLIPAVILILVAFPSLRILYLREDLVSPILTIKSIGNQWFWSYEYSDFSDIEFDSYMLPLGSPFNIRLLDTDHRILVPYNSSVRLMITSSDVIHSWAD